MFPRSRFKRFPLRAESECKDVTKEYSKDASYQSSKYELYGWVYQE